MGQRKRQKRVGFGVRQASGYGIAASCLLGLEVILFLSSVYISYLNQGKAKTWVGAIGFFVFAFSVTGLVLSVYGLCKKGRRHGPDFLGLIGNGLILAGVCILFVMGTKI